MRFENLRSRALHLSDPSSSPDDYIGRVGITGTRPEFPTLEHPAHWSPNFATRVAVVKARLKLGDSEVDLIAAHGTVVLRHAKVGSWPA